MDMRQYNEYTRGVSQYALPLNFELEGHEFVFVMDDGYDYTLKIIDRTTLEWNFEGDAPQKAYDYLCSKCDETTYLLSYELANAAKRTNHTWVIDLENWLVTRVISIVGENPRYEYLITPKYEFGAIKREGVETPVYPRHGFTSDLVGNVVQWYYGSETVTVHVYYCSDYYRITYPPERAAMRTINESMKKMPSSDEKVAYIKIKEGMYFFSITEANIEKILGNAFGLRSNTMVFLQDYRRVYQIGRAFGTRTMDGQVSPLHITFGACGKIIDANEQYIQDMLTAPNPFLP